MALYTDISKIANGDLVKITETIVLPKCLLDHIVRTALCDADTNKLKGTRSYLPNAAGQHLRWITKNIDTCREEEVWGRLEMSITKTSSTWVCDHLKKEIHAKLQRRFAHSVLLSAILLNFKDILEM
jgi:hypothetical protein